MVTPGYTHIWDCCCDHGLIGAALLSRLSAECVHFVDIVPELMLTVESNLQRFYPEGAWEVHCQDVSALPLSQFEGKQLVIIAGVGGDLMAELVESIYHHHQNRNIDFLLCPVNNPFTLRQKLIELDFGLKQEVLIEDNQRFYEIMLVSSMIEKNDPIDAVGSQIWQTNCAKQEDVIARYITKTLNHYRRLQRGNTGNVAEIINGYSAVVV